MKKEKYKLQSVEQVKCFFNYILDSIYYGEMELHLTIIFNGYGERLFLLKLWFATCCMSNLWDYILFFLCWHRAPYLHLFDLVFELCVLSVLLSQQPFTGL